MSIRVACYRYRGNQLVVVALACAGLGVAAAAEQAQSASCPFAVRPAYESHSFLGYACAGDCAAHKAGFAWAELNGISEPGACRAQGSRAFVQGCRAYAEEAVTAEQAGFSWARENEVTDRCACAGAGPRFEAGCAAYAAESAD